MRRKLLIASVAFVVLALGAVLAAPALLRGPVLDAVRAAADERLTVDVSLGGAKLSLFKSFPDLTVVIDDVVATGRDGFAGVVLADVEQLRATVDLSSVLGSAPIEIHEIALIHPKVDLRKGAEAANWQVLAGSGGGGDNPPSDVRLRLQELRIDGAELRYADGPGDLFVVLSGIDHVSSGDLSLQAFLLKTKTTIASASVGGAARRILDRARLAVAMDFDVDQSAGRLTIRDNAVRLNELTFAVTGTVDRKGDDSILDLAFDAQAPSLAQLVALIPGLAEGALKDMRSDGVLALRGTAKGAAGKGQLPPFDVALTVRDGSWSKADVPAAITGIDLQARVSNEGPTIDTAVIDVPSLRADLAGNPIQAALKVSRPTTSLDTDLVARGLVDLDALAPLVPLAQASQLRGRLDLEVDFRGSARRLADGSYRDADATGRVGLADVQFQKAGAPEPVRISEALLTLTPQTVEVAGLALTVGATDLAGSGRLDNLLGYLLGGEELSGQLQTQSRKLDVNGLLAAFGGDSGGGGGGERQTVRIPAGLNLGLDSRADEVTFNEMTLQAVRGRVRVQDEAAQLDGLDFSMLGGKVSLSGSYDSKPALPAVDMALSLKRVDVKQLLGAFQSVRALVPLAARSVGQVSTDLQVQGTFEDGMKLVLDSLDGVGELVAHQLMVEGTPVLKLLSDALKNSRFEQLRLDGSKLGFRIEDGALRLDRFPFRIGPIQAGFGGRHQFDGDMDYRLSLDMPAREFQGAASGVLDGLLKGTPFAGAAKLPDSITLDALIGGTVKKPTVRLDVQKLGQSAAETVLAVVEEVVGEQVDKALELARAQAEAQLANARKQADQARKQARAAADTAKKAAYRGADRLVSQASNPIARLAAEAASGEAKKQADLAWRAALKKADQEYDKAVAQAVAESKRAVEAGGAEVDKVRQAPRRRK